MKTFTAPCGRISDMREAVEALCVRKFGPGGPFHKDTPGPWKESARIRYLVRFIVGRGLQDEDKTTVCDVKSASENFLVSFKLQERIKGGKDSLFQNF